MQEAMHVFANLPLFWEPPPPPPPPRPPPLPLAVPPFRRSCLIAAVVCVPAIETPGFAKASLACCSDTVWPPFAVARTLKLTSTLPAFTDVILIWLVCTFSAAATSRRNSISNLVRAADPDLIEAMSSSTVSERFNDDRFPLLFVLVELFLKQCALHPVASFFLSFTQPA